MGRPKNNKSMEEAARIGKFGRWTILGEAEKRRYMIVICECGNTGSVRVDSLLNGDSSSCGCLAAENASKRIKTHGNCGKPLFQLWYDMNRRCYDTRRKDYHLYGGRGIEVCDRWNKNNSYGFDNFVEDMGLPIGAKNEIDRKDNDGDYCPENCQWASRRQQTNNHCLSRKISHDGFNLTVAEWSHLLGIPSGRLADRIGKLKQNVTEALETPFKTKHPTYIVDGNRLGYSDMRLILGLSDGDYYKYLRRGGFAGVSDKSGKSITPCPNNIQSRPYETVLHFLKTGEGIDDDYSKDIYDKYKETRN